MVSNASILELSGIENLEQKSNINIAELLSCLVFGLSSLPCVFDLVLQLCNNLTLIIKWFTLKIIYF